LSERSLELTVWDHDRLASKEHNGNIKMNSLYCIATYIRTH
jgi:hypothetical protein